MYAGVGLVVWLWYTDITPRFQLCWVRMGRHLNSLSTPHSTARFPVQLLARSLARTSLVHRSPEAELEFQVYPWTRCRSLDCWDREFLKTLYGIRLPPRSSGSAKVSLHASLHSDPQLVESRSWRSYAWESSPTSPTRTHNPATSNSLLLFWRIHSHPLPFIPHAEHSDTPRLDPASPCEPCARHVCCTSSLICSSFKTCYPSDQF